MTGISGRASLISNLAKALKSNVNFFGPDARPGNLLGELYYRLKWVSNALKH